jgi:nucleoside-diphosphate-sugar epimerase
MNNVLVTGGQGYVGSSLVPALLSKGYKVTSLDNGWFGNYLPPNKNLKIMQMDIRDISKSHLTGFDSVVHLAAISNDPLTELNPNISWEIGCLGTRTLLEASKNAGIKKFIYASSGSVYGVRHEPNVIETTELTPISLYNKVKIATERVVLSYSNEFKVNILRPATICGFSPRMRLDLAVNALTMSALTTGKIKLDGGSQIRPNIHIHDMCRAYLFFLENEIAESIINVGFENLSLLEIAKLVTSKIPSDISFSDSIDIRSYRLDSSKILALGFSPIKKISDAILELKEAYKNGLLVNKPEWHSTKFLSQNKILI